MIIFKPSWITHSDRAKGVKPCVYSIHVHPDGKRLATGGLDATVKIWSTEPLFDEVAEQNPDCHQLLCTMQRHSGAVLCVRWSNNDGRYLASSSDNDNVIIVWELDRDASSEVVFGSAAVNHEPWRPVKYLRAHESDVQDLAWSKDNQYLASCGVDGVVVVWNGSDFSQVTKIDQNGGFVKGVTWDPVGKYLACQSDDKMLKIWRTSDWGLEQEIKAPFINAPGTTLFRRLSWSPNGSHIVASNAVNGVHCIAAVVSREDWATDVSLVGHQLPIEVACFNPKLFYLPNEEDGTNSNDNNEASKSNSREAPATVCALAGQDRGVSIWVTKYCRPIIVATDIFDGNVYDLAWFPDGRTLLACSHDGTVACLRLDDTFSQSASDEEVLEQLTQYGYRGANGTAANGIYPESAEQLAREEQNAIASKTKRIADIMGSTAATSTTTATTTQATTEVPIPVTNISTSSDINRTTDNNVMATPNNSNNNISINNTHASAALPSSSASASTRNGLVIDSHKANQQAAVVASSQPTDADFTSSSEKLNTITEQTVTIGKDGKRRIKPVTIRTKTSMSPRPSGLRSNSPQTKVKHFLKLYPSPKACTYRLSIHIYMHNNSRNTLLSFLNNQIQFQDEARPAALIMTRNDPTTVYEFPSANIPSTTGVRSIATGTKRPPGSETQMDVDDIERTRKRPVWLDSAMLPPAALKSKIRLGVPKVKSTVIRPLRDDATKAVVMECDNPARAEDDSDGESDNEQKCARLTVTLKGQTMWQDYLPSAVMLMTGNGRFSAAACEDASIHVYSSAGRRILPPMVLESTPVILHCTDQWLLCLTCTGLLYTWDVIKMTSCLDGVSIAPVLNVARLPESTDDDGSDERQDAPSIKDVRIQKNGIPLLITNYRQAFAYHLGMKVWMRISDAWYIISEFWNSGMGAPTDYPLGWLSTAMSLNTGLDPLGPAMLSLLEGKKEAASAITLSHLEIQIAVAALLESPVEYRDWLKQYATRLSRENAQEKVKELCRWLVGPPFISKDDQPWEPSVLGSLSKHELLKEILPLLGSNRRLQRTVDEFSAYLL
ncbi:WD40-repeat-containing domain protein [Zychaea mexicana]|uniref:WD40-repeat-containing domain protein n=1 Tax=Zychaea mexicana TaxID=64656 RepID=UPI0022FE4CE0|nr:WD40-repeat-containing domain protein [Zychaea mexicana]KAI9496376.1 WD40-repeat-containing domain protein [Zychaea mexicana]